MTWREMEDLEKKAAAAHQRVQELETSLADTMVRQYITCAIPIGASRVTGIKFLLQVHAKGPTQLMSTCMHATSIHRAAMSNQ